VIALAVAIAEYKELLAVPTVFPFVKPLAVLGIASEREF
jgi:hypothetical protein